MHFIKLNLQLDTKQFLLHVLLVQAASPPPVQAASPSIPLLSLLDLAPLLKLLPLLSDIGTVGTVEILPLPRHPPAPAPANSATFCRAKSSMTYPALRTTSPRATSARMLKDRDSPRR